MSVLAEINSATKTERRAEREQALAGKILALPDKRYGVILADPPWRFEPWSRKTGMDRAADNHYPTQSLDEIKALDVPSISAPDCVLFLWATVPFLAAGIDVLRAWGFECTYNFVWAKLTKDGTKLRPGTGYWGRNVHEHLLLGTRGRAVAPAFGEQEKTIIKAPVEGHSVKPQIFMELIEAWYPNLPKIELHCRGLPRPGWDAYGLEAQQEAAE